LLIFRPIRKNTKRLLFDSFVAILVGSQFTRQMSSMNRVHYFQCIFFILLFCTIQSTILAQEIPEHQVLNIDALSDYLNPEVKSNLSTQGELSTKELAAYLRTKFAERFFYDHRTFEDRLSHYDQTYRNASGHKSRAFDHMGKYADSTQWELPFQYLNGTEVNAYALRHLARQHKMVDVAFHYFNDGKDPKYIRYFENQMRSLNAALEQGQYEKIEDGNGVYEVFRSGYRILNWLWIHNMFLNEPEYSDSDQLYTIATLLQHGAHLFSRNDQFRSGNHQTRGMSALAMLSILLRDFKSTDQWLERSMTRLGEHLEKEINADGFQFERSVHYHMSDINNFFYVYQLAKISSIPIEPFWEEKLRSLFTTLVKIAYPDKSAPVLQDDTEIPWGEKNEISGVMTLGYLLFEDPQFGYFAEDRVNASIYWFLQKRQLELLSQIERKKPTYGSLMFPETHYYVMREGWNALDKMMIISAGLDDKKPDHQHGDMLGIQGVANGQVILPNYQVRYSLEDFEFFKNSMVKNVALVDDELQGKQWTSNKGGSGFGKFKELPNPNVIAWESNDMYDLFIGSHDGFDDIEVHYTRQVLYLKDDFWIVKDNFKSDVVHTFKQVWQGHYTSELGPNLIRATFPDASGCDIFQLQPIDQVISDGTRGKHWTVLSKDETTQFNFITAIYPYRGYQNRIDETNLTASLLDWKINATDWKMKGENPVSLSKQNEFYFFGVDALMMENIKIEADTPTDLYVLQEDNALTVHLIGDKEQTITFSQAPGGAGEEMIRVKKDMILPGGQVIFPLK
jgi:hypothetical protein